MGLIRAAISAVGGTMADQWKEFFICESLDGELAGEVGWSIHILNMDGELAGEVGLLVNTNIEHGWRVSW